ncbi:MAG TPA: right-handed parallel beta-helix repeat-containing protein [Armatimonadota bacterium]
MFTAALSLFGYARAQAPAGSPTYNALNYGAVADGVTDNYAAFQRLAAAVSPPPYGTGTGKGTIVFPPGVYRINQYRILGGAQMTGIQNIYFRNCNGLTVTGTGATISVSGAFKRSADYTIAPYSYSYRQQVVPLYFYYCQNFVVDGFNLDGNIGQMTRDPGVVEGTSYGLATESCSNYTIKNITAHHFASDGLMIGASSPLPSRPQAIADRNGAVINVHAYNNARMALSVYQARGITISDSVFETAGIVPGAYGGHLPMSGAGIEPDCKTPGVNCDVKTGDITFKNCTFSDNVGMQWYAGGGDGTENVTLDGCTIADGPHSTDDYTMLLCVKNGLMQNSTMRGKRLTIVRGSFPNVSATIRNNKLYSNAFAIVADGQPATALIDNNDIIGTYAGPTSNLIVYLQNMPNVDFVNNRVFVPAADKSGTGGQGVVWLNNIHSSQNNTFTTDLTGASTSHFCATYTACPTYQDHYNSGTYFRPAFNSTFNAANPYSTVTGAVPTLLPSITGGLRHLAFDVAPGKGSMYLPLASQPVISVRDAAGAVDSGFSGSVTVALKAGSGPASATLTGITTVAVANGIARFTDLIITKPGTGFVLTAGASGLAAVDSVPFSVTQLPSRIAFAVQPAASAAGQALSAQPVAVIQDADGNLVPTFTGPISLSIKDGTGSAGAVLTGTSTVTAVNGVAAFSDIGIDQPGADFVLVAGNPGLTPAESRPFGLLLPGDLDADGSLTLADVGLALRCAAGISAAPSAFSVGDLAGAPAAGPDGRLGIEDAVAIVHEVMAGGFGGG